MRKKVHESTAVDGLKNDDDFIDRCLFVVVVGNHVDTPTNYVVLLLGISHTIIYWLAHSMYRI